MPSEMSDVFEVFELSGDVPPVAEPPQALNASRTTRPVAAVWILLLVFVVIPFEWFSYGVLGFALPGM